MLMLAYVLSAAGAESLLAGLIYFLIAFLVCCAVYWAVTQFFPRGATIVGIILAIVLLLVALRVFGLV